MRRIAAIAAGVLTENGARHTAASATVGSCGLYPDMRYRALYPCHRLQWPQLSFEVNLLRFSTPDNHLLDYANGVERKYKYFKANLRGITPDFQLLHTKLALISQIPHITRAPAVISAHARLVCDDPALGILVLAFSYFPTFLQQRTWPASIFIISQYFANNEYSLDSRHQVLLSPLLAHSIDPFNWSVACMCLASVDCMPSPVGATTGEP